MLLYYTRDVNPTIIIVLNSIVAQQAKTTTQTTEEIVKLLNYCIAYPNTKITQHASDMILYKDYDVSNLSLLVTRR